MQVFRTQYEPALFFDSGGTSALPSMLPSALSTVPAPIRYFRGSITRPAHSLSKPTGRQCLISIGLTLFQESVPTYSSNSHYYFRSV